MELRQLRYFVATAQTLSFSAAARRQHITQSTLSQQIRQLEDEMGSPLFERDSHRVSLTEAGDRLLPLALQALQSTDACLTQIKDMSASVTGELNIGVTHSFSTLLTAPLIKFVHTYREVKLHIYYADSLRLAQMLKDKSIDLALAYRANPHHEEFESYELFRDRLCAIVRHDHLLAGRKSITLAELEKENWGIAMPSEQMQVRQMLDKELEREGEVPHLRKRIELNDANFILDLVDDSDLLVAILSEGTLRHRKGLVAIPLIPSTSPSISPYAYQMSGCVHVLKNTYMKCSARIFVDMLKSSVQALPQEMPLF